MKHCKIFVLIGLILFSPAVFAVEIMPLSEVKEGMVGVGRTVFKGNNIEEFQVEILGVLRNFLPQQSLILGILKGGSLEETGVIAGMSGSPVFINGKMIGAVAYSWPFSKTPFAGITPIESMLEAQTVPVDQVPIAPPIEIAQSYNFESLMTSHFAAPPKVGTNVPGIGKIELSPISAPLMVSGFNRQLVDRFEPLFAAFGLHAMQGAANTIEATPANADLEPGSPISVQLVRGDFDIGAIGTVTYRDQEKVLAFGHQFFNLGPIDFPMATARIFAVVPSLFSSFKVGSGGTIVGSVRQDRHAGVFGIMGQKSPMIPITLRLKNGEKQTRNFQFDVVNHKLLSPVLLDFAFQNSILVTQLGYSESTLKVSGAINMRDGNTIQVSNIFSGSGSFSTASQYLASILYTLMMNEFKNVEVEDVVIDVDFAFKRRDAELVEVWVDRTEVRPGEMLKLKAVYRPFQQEKQIQEFNLKIPEDLSAGTLQFLVGGGQDISRQEFAQFGKAYEPDNLEQVILLLNSLRSNDRIYVKAFLSEPNLVMKGNYLYHLPSSAFSVLSSSQTIGSSQRINSLTLSEDSRPIDYFLTGTKLFSVRVLPKQN